MQMSNQKNAELAIVISHGRDLRTRNITKMD